VKILWLVNILMPKAAQLLGQQPHLGGGWLTGQLDVLESTIHKITVCCTGRVKADRWIEVDGITYVVVPAEPEALRERFSEIIKQISPDVIHIHGTELSHTLAMLESCKEIPIVVSIQGLVSVYAKHFMDGLPKRYRQISLLHHMLRGHQDGSIRKHQIAFEQYGETEIASIALAKNIIGRTAWDEYHTKRYQPNVRYFKVNENLRAGFYDVPLWSLATCRRHSIFVSQASYPIKGMHQLLKALPKLVKKYPDLEVFIGGNPPRFYGKGFKNRVNGWKYEYTMLLRRLERRGHLAGRMHFVGPLEEKEMIRYYRQSHVFVSPSCMENSSNSIGEAMLLGMPVVASAVGGTISILKNETEGLLYDFHDIEGLADCIDHIFSDDALAERLGSAAHLRARITHDRQRNTDDLLAVYKTIMSRQSEAE